MKLSLFFIAFFAFSTTAYSIGAYKVGDKLYVLAANGLVLRQTADPQGERLADLVYGDAITVIQDVQAKVIHFAEEFPGYKIRGYWVRVKDKNNQEGYVFDGYLSKYPAPGTVIADPKDSLNNSPAELFLLTVTAKKGVSIPLPKEANQYKHYRQLFKNGAQVEFSGGEGGSSQILIFEKGIMLEEAYLIGQNLHLKGMKFKSTINKGVISLESEDGHFLATIETKAGFAVLKMAHAD